MRGSTRQHVVARESSGWQQPASRTFPLLGGMNMGQAQSTPRQQRYSYASRPRELVNRLREAHQLYRTRKQGTGDRVYFTLSALRQCAMHLQEHFGLKLEGLEILEVGPGQQLEHMRALSVKNQVTGIDTDIVLQGFHLRDYVELLRQGPVLRAAKTVTRKLFGWDTLFEKSLAQSLGVQCFPRLPLFRMDPTRMTFPDASFDLVCSWSAFEHIERPRTALAELARVLRPGGIAYLVIHLNEVRLDAWRQVFQEMMPGVRLIQDELRTARLIGVWRKPHPD
jgi:hypothetical protein